MKTKEEQIEALEIEIQRIHIKLNDLYDRSDIYGAFAAIKELRATRDGIRAELLEMN